MIETEDYVRINGIIGRVEQIGNSLFWIEDGSSYSLDDKAIKHSKNIIDLIELYDYVNGMIVFDIITYDNGEKAIKISSGYLMSENEIQDILTHEQYQANCYTVERNEE